MEAKLILCVVFLCCNLNLVICESIDVHGTSEKPETSFTPETNKNPDVHKSSTEKSIVKPINNTNCEFLRRNAKEKHENLTRNLARKSMTFQSAQSKSKRSLQIENATKQESGILKYRSEVAVSTSPSSNVSSDLKFLDVPRGGGMKVPTVDIGEGNIVFSYISGLVGGLQPQDFPSDLLRDWLWKRITVAHLILQSIRMESGFLACIVVFIFLALALPSAVIAQACCRLAHPGTGDCSPGSEPPVSALKCRKLLLLIYLQLMLLLIPFGIVGMFMSNEQLAVSLQKVPTMAHAVMDDMRTFVRNSQLQIRFVATTSADSAIDTAIKELDDVEELLGKPIQREIAIETGIDVALDALSDICSASKDVAAEVQAVRSEAQATREAIKLSQDRLLELAKQVDTTKMQCFDKDKPLCDTVDTMGLEILMRVDKILAERKLSRLRHLGEDNLTAAVEMARDAYQNIPIWVVKDTEPTRAELKHVLSKQKDSLYNSVQALEDISKTFDSSIGAAESQVAEIVATVAEVEPWRWMVGLGASITVLLIWTLMTFAVLCDSCGFEARVIPSLLTSLVLICTLSIFLWALASVALFLGGNGHVYVCRPLYDDPRYATLSLLLDNPGLLYQNGGMFSNILKGNDSLDVPLKNILKECHENQPVFPTLTLNRILNIDTLTNHLTWPKLHAHLSNLTVDIHNITILTPTLQKYLQDLSHASRINLTAYRASVSGPITTTDLGGFADQLERVANQMSDLTTSARMEALASRTRKLMSQYIHRLEKHKEELIYKLTALQVHLVPLQRQANQSLSHLKTIQFYLDSQGVSISTRKTAEYVNNIIKYLEKFRLHVSNRLTYEIAPCKPLWDIFQATRQLFCKEIVDPMNGFWVSTVWCLLLFIMVVPAIMILADFYKDVFVETQLHRDLGELLLEDQRIWTTQTPQTPESLSPPEHTTWTTPRDHPPAISYPPPRKSSKKLKPHELLRLYDQRTWARPR